MTGYMGVRVSGLPATLSALSDEGLRADNNQEMSCLLLLLLLLGDGFCWLDDGDIACAWDINGDADDDDDEEEAWCEVELTVLCCECGLGLAGKARVTLRWCRSEGVI